MERGREEEEFIIIMFTNKRITTGYSDHPKEIRNNKKKEGDRSSKVF